MAISKLIVISETKLHIYIFLHFKAHNYVLFGVFFITCLMNNQVSPDALFLLQSFL